MSAAKPILIAGPTASGKSGLALALAQRFGGVVINADSMQVYRELAILTARPADGDLARAPHRLYGHVPAAEPYSAGRYAGDVAAALSAVRANAQRAIVVGGTGLYFKVLLEGLSPIPQVAASIRGHWRAEARRLGPLSLHAQLAQREPEMADRLAAGDHQRVTRALEVFEASGHSLAHWQRQPGKPILAAADTIRLVVQIDRAVLAARCDARFDAMLAAGALAEVAAFRALGLDPALPATRALGVRPLAAHLDGALALAAAVATAKSETRQYAKRQTTWLRRHMQTWHAVSSAQLDHIARDIWPLLEA